MPENPNDKLTKEFWDEEAALLLAILLPALKSSASNSVLISAAELRANFGISADWTDATSAAAEWARRHSAELVSGITRTTKRALQRSIASWLETPGATMGDLYRELEQLYAFSPSRARAIAVSETTDAYAEGNQQAYIEAGIPPMAYQPKAHVRCRCWPGAVLLSNGDFVVTWRTNRDELVCRQPLETPWGGAVGCRDLNNRVISEGQYLGMKLREARRVARGEE